MGEMAEDAYDRAIDEMLDPWNDFEDDIPFHRPMYRPKPVIRCRSCGIALTFVNKLPHDRNGPHKCLQGAINDFAGET